jgi:hypothetical protein
MLPVASESAFQILGAEENPLAHDLAGFELHGGARGNRDVDIGLVGVATDP